MKKNTMKKLLAASLSLSLALSLAACGGNTAESSDSGAATQTGDGYRVAVIKQMDHASLDEIANAIVARIDEIEAELAAAYPDARRMVINGIATVAFTDKNSDVAGYAMLDSMKPGLYTFFMTPASDQSFKDTATSIAISIRNMQE